MMKENYECGDTENNEDETVENVNVEKEMAGSKTNEEYQRKVLELQQWIPALRRVMDTMDPSGQEEVQTCCRQRLELVYQLIQKPNTDKPMKFECLEKLERILKAIADKVKVKKKRGDSPSLKSLAEETSQIVEKMYHPNNHGGKKLKRLLKDKQKTILKKGGKDKRDKVPHIGDEHPANKTSVAKREKYLQYFSDDLFTPDVNVSRVRPSTSQESSSDPRSFTESKGYRPRFTHSEREASGPTYPALEQRCRGPFFNSEARFRPAYTSGNRHRSVFYSDSRFRPPFSEKEERFRPHLSDREDRNRHPFGDNRDTHRPSYKDDEERYYEKPKSFEREERQRHPLTYSQEVYKPAFTDAEERYYEKPKSGRKIEREEANSFDSSRSRPHERSVSSSSVISKYTIEKKHQPVTEASKKEHITSAVSSSSSYLNIESSLGSSDILETLEDLQQKDLEKLTQSTQRLKSNLNHRLKNMEAQKRLLKEASTAKISEESGHKEVTQEKCLRIGDEPSKEPISKINSLFLDGLMSNLTSKFSYRRAPLIISDFGRSTSKADTVVVDSFKALEKTETKGTHVNESNSNMIRKPIFSEEDKAELVLTVKQILQEKAKAALSSASTTTFTVEKQSNFAPISNDDTLKGKAAASSSASTNTSIIEKQLNFATVSNNETLKEKAAASSSASSMISFAIKQSNLTTVRVDDTLKGKVTTLSSVSTITSIAAKQANLATVSTDESVKSCTSNLVPKDNSKSKVISISSVYDEEFLNIPGLDGIIPPDLERSPDLPQESIYNKTKDQCIVTKGYLSSQENDLKSNFIESEIGQGYNTNELKPKLNLNETVTNVNHNEMSNSSINEDLNRSKPNQSLRSKLSGEITTLHKVGTPCGGSLLRGLVKRDKMMPSGQVASLKPGALYDLISEDKPSRSAAKAKNRPHSQQMSSSHTYGNVNTSCEILKTPVGLNELENSPSTVKTNNPDEILSKLSEVDLKKIITENIGTLPTPPNLPFLSNAISSLPSSNFSLNVGSSGPQTVWNNQSSLMHPHNVSVNNTPPVENINNNSLLNQQPGSNWGKPEITDSRQNKILKDPRREALNTATQVPLPNHTLETGKNVFIPNPQTSSSSFENTSYNTSICLNPEKYKGSEREMDRDTFHPNSYTPSIVLQSDPLKSPCYDGSTTPDPYRADPYTMNMRGFEKQGNLTEQYNAYSRSSLLADPHTNFGRDVSQRPPLLQTPPLSAQRHVHYSQERESYSNFRDNHQSNFNDFRNIRSAPITYGEWKAEKSLAESRKYNNHFHGDRATDNRNFNRYRWTNSDTSSTSYDHRRDFNSQYRDSVPRTQQRESESMKKLSARDPRRRSIEDNLERNECLLGSKPFSKIENNSDSTNLNSRVEQYRNVPKSTVDNYQERPSRRAQERTQTRGRSACRDQGYYGSNARSLSRNRKRSPSQGRSPTRRSSELTNKPKENNKDTYSSPLDQLYTNTSTPQTGLGYGVQKFRIPKLKTFSDNSSKPHVKDTYCGKDNAEDNQQCKMSSDREMEFKGVSEKDLQKTCESEKDQVSDAEIKKENDGKKEDIEIQDLENDAKDTEVKDEVSEDQNVPLSSDEITKEDDLKTSPCRRSKRLITKKSGKLTTPTRQKKQNENQKNEVIPKEMTAVDDEPQFQSSPKAKKGTKPGSEEIKELGIPESSNDKQDNVYPDVNVEIEKSPQVNITTTEKSDQTNTKSEILNKEVLISESVASKTVDVSDPITPSIINDLKKDVSDESTCENGQLPQNINEMDKIPDKGSLETTNTVLENAELVSLSDKMTDVTDSNSQLAESSVTPPEPSVVKSENKEDSVTNSSVNLSTGPEIKIIKQVELLEDLIGMKLTPDKLRKVAEILSAPETKENTKEEKPQEDKISEPTKLIQEPVADLKLDHTKIDIDATSSGENKDKSSDEIKLPINDVTKLDVHTVSSTDDGQLLSSKSNKTKVLKKRKINTPKSLIVKEDHGTESVTQKPKRKYKSELDRLQDDISKYHDSEAIAAASGPRQCRLQKEKNQNIGKTPYTKSSQEVKRKVRKCKEDESDDSEDVSIKDEFDQSKEENSDDDSMKESDEVKEDDVTDDELKDEDTEEENNESKYTSDSSDDVINFSKKIKSRYSFLQDEEQNSGETKTMASRSNNSVELVSLTVNTKIAECSKSGKNEVGSQDKSVKEISGSSVQEDGCNKTENIQLKGSGESNADLEAEQCIKNLSGEKDVKSGDEENSSKEFSNSTLNKYGLKKQRKKSFWSAGIIRKKSKSKKSDTTDTHQIEDTLNTFESDEDDMLNEGPDLNYYQEGDSKPTKCKLCSFYGKSIVTHYAITHPKDEVLISRMSSEAAEIAQKESTQFFSLSDDKKKDYSLPFVCRICNMKTFKFLVFFEHMALHTGEFRHECCKCGYRTSTRPGILKHYQSHNVKNVNNKSCRVVYKEPADKTVFCGYLCSLCNYFQISQNNVKLHVHNVHETLDTNHVVKINFSKVTISETDLNHEPSEKSSVEGKSGDAQSTSVGKKEMKKPMNMELDSLENNPVISGNKPTENDRFQTIDFNDAEEGIDTQMSHETNKHSDKELNSDTLEGNLIKQNLTETLTCVGNTKCSDSNDQNKEVEQGTIEKVIDCDSISVGLATNKIKPLSLNNNAEDISGTNAVSTDNTEDSCLEANVEDTFKEQKGSSCDSEGALTLKGTTDLNSEQETHLTDTEKSLPENNISDSILEGDTIISDSEECTGPMLIENDWYDNMNKQIKDFKEQYLLKSARSSVSSQVEKLKTKADISNIVDEIHVRCTSVVDNPLLLDSLLIPYVCIKVKKEKDTSIDKCNQSLSDENEEEKVTTPMRRHLPERTCKGVIIKQDKEIDEVCGEEEDEMEIYKMVMELGYDEGDCDSEVIVKDEVGHETLTNVLMSTSNELENTQVLPCLSAPVKRYIEKNTTRKPLSIQDKRYISSLPVNSNCSEFTHVMKQITQVTLKVSEIKEIKVGGLKAHPAECGVVFSCSVKIFNKECGFQTSDLEVFGQHVNMSHHTSFWNGVCSACLLHFVRDPNSHDKVSINTQSKAFCHLVREHLTFTKKITKSSSRGSLTNEAPVTDETTPPPPRLRVRRFSGDKLSGTDAENVLPRPTKEIVPGRAPDVQVSLLSSDTTGSDVGDSSKSAIEMHLQTPDPTAEEVCLGIQIFKPHQSLKEAKSTFKLERLYTEMCCYSKLMDLYKCMGARCSFTTMSLKAFAKHVDEHKEIYLENPVDDPHRGFWSVCSYCLIPHSTSKELCIHIRKEHGICTMQCSLCFYRAKSIANVHFHFTVEHSTDTCKVLSCDQLETNLPPVVERPFTEFVSAFRCFKGGCCLFTYMLQTFCDHLMEVHPQELRCHMCLDAHPNISSLLVHYCDKHGIGLYQCLYCTFGSPTEHVMRLHLCQVHPNMDPKALQRIDNNQQQYPNMGSMRRESIKRLMFNKDQDKLMRYIHTPTPEDDDIVFFRRSNSGSSQVDPNTNHETNDNSSIDRMKQRGVLPLAATDRSKHSRSVLKRPSGEALSPTKVFILSSSMSPNEGGKVVTVRIPVNSPSQSSNPSTPPLSTTLKVTETDDIFNADSSVDDSTSSSRLVIDTDASTVPSDTSVNLTAEDDSYNVEEDVSILDASTTGNTESPSVVNYFKCGNKDCYFETSTATQLTNHLVICDQGRVLQKLSCTYCKRRFFKQTLSFVEHLRIHGPERFSCSLCNFKSPLVARVNSHMKACHNVLTTYLVPVIVSKQDPEQDYFIVSCKEKRTGGEKPGPKGKVKIADTKTRFSLEELEDVPHNAIFLTPLGCRLCSYETKVRSNLIRHLQQHTFGDSVSKEEFVNPVPDKTEKMFDKMMNLAGSSHKKKTSGEHKKDELAVDCLYKYVSDQDRYKCHVRECGYRTLSETMLRDHISVIHKDEIYYICPHCSTDGLPIPIDQLGMHLKLHDAPVFKCGLCSFCSHIKRPIERHIDVVHPNDSVDILVVRLTKPDQSLALPVPKLTHPTDKTDEQGEEWYYCNQCVFKTKKKKFMLPHGAGEHKMAKPFRCSACGYEAVNEQHVRDHLRTQHPDGDSQLIALYRKVTEVKKPVLPPIPPLWKRDVKRLKLIRGIKLDEKGDAPPPVATATSGALAPEVLELKFGHFGKAHGSSFTCPRCSTFSAKNRHEMKEHLFNHLDYTPIKCKICKSGSTQRTKIMKHLNKDHDIPWSRISELMEINLNQEVENWVEEVLSRQGNSMSEPSASSSAAGSSEPPRKRRRSSTEAVGATSAHVYESPATPPPASSSSAGDLEEVEDTLSSQQSSSSKSSVSDDKDELKSPEKRKRDKCPSRHRFICAYCEVTTKYKHSIILHCKKFHPDCPPRVKDLEKNVEPRTERNTDESTEAFNCMYCNCIALNLNNLKHHWTHTHKNSGLNFLFRNTTINIELQYECYWCKKQDDLESLEVHCGEDHPEEQRFLVVSFSVPKYKCSECNIVYKTMYSLKKHFTVVHPSKRFSCTVINTRPPPDHIPPSPTPSQDLPGSPSQPKLNITYKCFKCHIASPKFWHIVKHMHRHFVSYVCAECEHVSNNLLHLNDHMCREHPSSIAEPRVVGASDADIEQAKKKISVILESGLSRKITEEELAEAEKENKPEEDSIEMDTHKGVHKSPFVIKETARKSTGSLKYRAGHPSSPTSPHKSPRGPRNPANNMKQEDPSLTNTYVTVESHGKIIRLPVKTFRKLINFDAEPDLTKDLI